MNITETQALGQDGAHPAANGHSDSETSTARPTRGNSKPTHVNITIEPKLRHYSFRSRQKPSPEEIGSHVWLEDYADIFPTLSLSHRAQKDPAVTERLKDAVEYGQSCLFGRYALYNFSHSQHFLSRSQETTFAYVLKTLREMLTLVWVDNTQEVPTLYVNESAYDSLRSILEACRRIAAPAFRRLKKPVPPIPIWGGDNTYSQYAYEANDFEILGACFRREVEYFLSRLAAVHPGPYLQERHFLQVAPAAGEDSAEEELATAFQKLKVKSPQPPRDIPPHLPADSISQ